MAGTILSGLMSHSKHPRGPSILALRSFSRSIASSGGPSSALTAFPILLSVFPARKQKAATLLSTLVIHSTSPYDVWRVEPSPVEALTIGHPHLLNQHHSQEEDTLGQGFPFEFAIEEVGG